MTASNGSWRETPQVRRETWCKMRRVMTQTLASPFVCGSVSCTGRAWPIATGTCSNENALECHDSVPLGDGLDIVRHAFDRGARCQISLPDLPGHRTGPADPDWHVGRLNRA